MSNPSNDKRFGITRTCKTLQTVLLDHDLAALGDAYTNLIYSLYLSSKAGKPIGAKASSSVLSKALKEAGLRELLPSRLDRHRQADAAEALLVYVWLQDLTSITENVKELMNHQDAVEGFSHLLSEARRKARV